MEKKTVSGIMFTLLFIGMLTLAFNIKPVAAYKSGADATHQFIFQQARTILQNDGYVSYADFLDSVEPSSGLTYSEIMIKGSDENDGLIAAREHYMDPMDHKGLLFIWYQKSAGTLCQERFDEAVSQWQSGNYYNAFYNLGWAAHLVQDVCVPHHAWTTYLDWHSEYEDWVNSNRGSFSVNSGGIYSFPSFPDLQCYTPRHYSGVNTSAYDWVDYNAHESIKYFLSVDSYTGTNITDAANPYIETIHPLPNNLETTWVITTYQTSGMQLHFEKIDMEYGFDYIRIYDKYDNLLDTYTGNHTIPFWTPWYNCGDTLKIKVTTDSIQSWGYKIKEVKYFDLGENLIGATEVLLPRAQRTTAGFIKFFFDKALSPIYIKSDGSVGPPTAPIQRNGDIYTFTNNIYRPIVVEKDNIIINGNGRTLQPTYSVGDGFYLSGRNNVTIQNVTVKGFWSGIFVWNSTKITLAYNSLTGNRYGLSICDSSNYNKIFGSNITANKRYGIFIYSSSNYNHILLNNITANEGDGILISFSSNYNNVYANTITNNHQSGVDVEYFSNYNSVYWNKITQNDIEGIELWVASNYNNIYENDISANSFAGFSLLESSSNNNVSKNNVTNNGYGFVVERSSNYNSIYDNCIAANNYWGITLYRSLNNSISGNDIKANKWDGIQLSSSNYTSIVANNITHNSDDGVFLYSSSYNSIHRNNITSNARGIGFMDSSNHNNITENTISANIYQGINIHSSSNNAIYHNNFINGRHVYTDSSVNLWDDGYPSGGNYWSDYTGVDHYSGPYQNITGSDGIGDTPYIINGTNQDRYPLIYPWGTGIPVASFVWSPSVPEVNEVVTFDASASMPIGGEIVSYEWDFGDGNQASGKIVTHRYSSAGSYTATLNVTDNEGLWDIEQKQIEVKAPPPPLTVSISPTSASILVGQSVTFTSTVSGGVTPYSYQWYLNGNPVSGATSNTWAFTPTTSGIYYVYLKVTDAKGNTAQSETARITAATVPVGGYSVPIDRYIIAKPLMLYFASVAILTIAFAVVGRKTPRKPK